MKQVSIIIPTYNHLSDCLRQCIDSVLRYTDMNRAELIISANGCTDGTGGYLSGLVAGRDDQVKYVWSKDQLGYARAVNRGLLLATGQLIVLLNNDTVLLEQPVDEWLRTLMCPFAQDNVAVSGPLINMSPVGREFLVFFCAMLRRSVIKEIGSLDENFEVGGGEDMDWCHRAEDAGYKIVRVPAGSQTEINNGRVIGNFPIYHQAEATIREIKEHPVVYRRNLLKLLKKWPNEAARVRLLEELDRLQELR
jgi:GT2 family glycosyltransferase